MLITASYALLPWPSTAEGATIGPTANAVGLIKVYIPTVMDISTVSFETVSTPDGVFFGFGIYTLDGNTLVVDSGPIVVPVHGGGGVTVQGTFSSVTIGSGLYWMAYTCDTPGSGLRPIAETSTANALLCDGTSILGTAANASVGGQLPSTTGTITPEAAPGSSIAPLVKWE